jgi:hypothetical protein
MVGMVLLGGNQTVCDPHIRSLERSLVGSAIVRGLKAYALSVVDLSRSIHDFAIFLSYLGLAVDRLNGGLGFG